MNLSNILDKIYSGLVLLSFVSIAFLMVLFSMKLAEWPVFSLSVFVIWSVTLCAWAYRGLKEELSFATELQADDFNAHRGERCRKLRAKYLYFFLAVGLFWMIFCQGGPTFDFEAGELDTSSVMASMAVKYFGTTYTTDGPYEADYTHFRYTSISHHACFIVLSFLPMVILVVGGCKIFVGLSTKLEELERPK